jgi:DNA-binding NarL/FixJ family response regulator
MNTQVPEFPSSNTFVAEKGWLAAGTCGLIRVIIAHPTPLVRVGLQVTLGAHADMQIVSAPDSTNRPDATDLTNGDVVVTDYDSGVRLASSAGPSGCSVLIVTIDASEASIRRAIEAGAHGYLLLTSRLEAIVDAVRSIHRGDTAIDPAVAAKMVSSLRYPRLTDREYEILRLLLLGLSDKAIAATLGRSAGTVKTHVKSVLSKLNATSRTHAVSVARQRGLVQEWEPDGQIRKPLPAAAALPSRSRRRIPGESPTLRFRLTGRPVGSWRVDR